MRTRLSVTLYVHCRACNRDSRSTKGTQTTTLAYGYERPVIQFRPGRRRQRTDPSVFQQQRKESRTLLVQDVGPEMTDKTSSQRKYYLLLPCAISLILGTCTLFLYSSRNNQQQQCVLYGLALASRLGQRWTPDGLAVLQ